MSASVSAMPAGQPSTTAPMAGPWDSPKLVTQKSLPRVLPDMMNGLLESKTDEVPDRSRHHNQTWRPRECGAGKPHGIVKRHHDIASRRTTDVQLARPIR